MRTIISLIIIIVCAAILISCHMNKKQKPTEIKTPDPDETDDPVDDETVSSSEYLILKLNYQPGGDITKEEFDTKSNTWQIMSDRHVTDKNGAEITLSRKDMDKIIEFYSNLCNGNVTEEDVQICDGPSYSLIVYTENNEMLAYDWNYSHQVEEVYQIAEIIWEYY